ncbi:hypothetical protein H6F74_22520 [Trichocoleus sp. FACHB-90]|uniref:DUF7733 domain-containing protein n=1 Tax=Cyanophyceae TaxID=3028117 RepID=UPI0016886251|nr:hypothetical protein [Trichocoleus sp. FACHB-90]MBD1928998.1 hypothetical protein [Trichocoleus sp. FACHB-90]
MTASTMVNIFIENILFVIISTSFLVFVDWVWRQAKPFSIPQPLPTWFKAWLSVVLVVGVLFPVLAIVLWGVWWNHESVLLALIPYLVMLALQILSESVTSKRFQSCVWVMIPCLYLPYRVWQLYSGLMLLSLESETIWVQRLLVVEIVLWIFNYGVHLSQIPRLLRWELQPEKE